MEIAGPRSAERTLRLLTQPEQLFDCFEQRVGRTFAGLMFDRFQRGMQEFVDDPAHRQFDLLFVVFVEKYNALAP